MTVASSATGSPASEAFTVTARDGYALAADFHPAQGEAHGAVLIAGAMGVPRRFYTAFASYLARYGLAALRFDYRGFGGSAPKKLRGFDASITHWIDHDLPAVLDALAARAPGAPRLWLGHSVGGQLLGFMPPGRVDAALLVASQSGHWAHWPTRAWRARLWVLSHLVMPASAALLGRVPGALFGGGDLPAGVARQWSAWIRDPEYLGLLARERGWAGFRHYDRPLKLVTITDDDYAPQRTGEVLLSRFPQARAEHEVVTPASLGVPRIGHFDGFRPAFEASLWAGWKGWLLAQAAAAHR